MLNNPLLPICAWIGVCWGSGGMEPWGSRTLGRACAGASPAGKQCCDSSVVRFHMAAADGCSSCPLSRLQQGWRMLREEPAYCTHRDSACLYRHSSLAFVYVCVQAINLSNGTLLCVSIQGLCGALVMVGQPNGEPREVFCRRGAMENLARTFGAKNLEIWKGENYSQLRKMN